jgi:hypothetical protein
MRGLVLGVALAVMLPAQSFALTVLCAESGSTGFNWREGKWVNSDYNLERYIVQDVTDDPVLGEYCQPTPPTAGDYGVVTGTRCFNQSSVGEVKSVFATTTCRIYYKTDMTTITTAYCEGGYAEIKFEPTGEFVMSRTYAAPDSDKTAVDQRDSLVLSVGKCSVVAP